MNPFNHINCHRDFGKPKNWDETKNGKCETLPIMEWTDPISKLQFMVSYWKPSEEEIQQILDGKCIVLGVNGRIHPVVFVGTEV